MFRRSAGPAGRRGDQDGLPGSNLHSKPGTSGSGNGQRPERTMVWP